MLSQLKWARVGLSGVVVLALLSGSLAWAKKPVPPAPPEPPITYSATYLGVLPGNDASYAQDINNNGTVVGHCNTGSNKELRRAFVSYIDDTGQRTMQDLNDLVEISEFGDDYLLSFAYGINDKGQIAGGAWVPGNSSTGSSFRFTPGYTDADTGL